METELADRLAGLETGIARIDSHCKAIHDNQEKSHEALVRHEERDRLDFKEVHHRITKVERKQNWILGVGTAGAFTLALVSGFFKGIFGGP